MRLNENDSLASSRGFGRRTGTRGSKVGPALLLAWGVLAALQAPVCAQTSRPPAVIFAPGNRTVYQGTTPTVLTAPALDPQTAALMQQVGLDPNVSVTAEFDPPVISLGQPATFRVTVTAMIEGVSLPDAPPAPPGMTLTFGGRGFNYGGLGGIMQPRTTVNYRVGVQAAGNYVVSPFEANANGRKIKTPEARLTVLPPGAPGAREALRVEVEAPPEEFYVGQSIPLRLVVRDAGDNRLQAVSQPQVAGEAVLFEQGLQRQSREVRQVNGRSVPVSLASINITPIKAGRIEFVAQAYAHVMRTTPNAALGIGMTMDTVLVNSDPVAITVKHLPKEGELAGFTGGIGSFVVEPPRLSTNLVRAGEPVSLTITIRGDGNLTRLNPPRLDRAPGWQVFPPLSDNPGSLQMALRGSAIFTYTLVPLSERTQATPAMPFCFFDLKRRAYVDATIPPVAIRVLPAPGGAPAVAETASAPARGLDDPDQAETERELVMAGLAEKPGSAAGTLAPLQTRPGFLLLQFFPAAALGGLWIWDRRRRRLAAHPHLVLRARARRRLRRHLRAMRRAAAGGDAAGFITASVDALREARAPAEAANPQALVCADVLRGLPPLDRQGPVGLLVTDLFNAADANRFLEGAADGASLLRRRAEIETLVLEWREKL